MKLRIIQENTVVVVTILRIPNKIKNSAKKKKPITLIDNKADCGNYLEISLYDKQNEKDMNLHQNSMWLGADSVGNTDVYRFYKVTSAANWIRKLKNSIKLLNHGTEVEIEEFNNSTQDTIIETIE